MKSKIISSNSVATYKANEIKMIEAAQRLPYTVRVTLFIRN